MTRFEVEECREGVLPPPRAVVYLTVYLAAFFRSIIYQLIIHNGTQSRRVKGGMSHIEFIRERSSFGSYNYGVAAFDFTLIFGQIFVE